MRTFVISGNNKCFYALKHFLAASKLILGNSHQRKKICNFSSVHNSIKEEKDWAGSWSAEKCGQADSSRGRTCLSLIILQSFLSIKLYMSPSLLRTALSFSSDSVSFSFLLMKEHFQDKNANVTSNQQNRCFYTAICTEPHTYTTHTSVIVV